MKSLLSLFLVLFFISCNGQDDNNTSNNNAPDDSPDMMASSTPLSIENVAVSGNENNYQFSVTLSSPDTGCEQYANWWEVISEDGSTLIYRRVLGHSHVNEQPFTRSGSGVDINATDVVIIRGHMNNTGYSTNAMKGSVSKGFTSTTLDNDFAPKLSTLEPLPNNCAF